MKQKLIPFIDAEGKNHWPLHVDQKTGILYYMKRFNGRLIKFSTKCKADQIKKAHRIANDELAKRLGTKKTTRPQSLIKDETPAWIAIKEGEGLAEDTLKNIRNGRKQFEKFWGDRRPLEMLNPDTRAEFYVWFAQEYPGQQMENAIKQLRSFSGYLSEKVVGGSPLLPTRPKFNDPNKKNIRRARKKKKQRVFTEEEFSRVHSAAANEIEALVIHIMYVMASRIDETLNMRFGVEILLDESVPLYRWSDGQNKADLDGCHALHPSLIGPLQKLRDRRRAEGTAYLFPQKFNNQAPLKEQQIDWAAWRKRAELDWHWTTHTFRHACLTSVFSDESLPQAIACKLYRVSLQVAMETYIHVTATSIEKFRAAIKVNL